MCVVCVSEMKGHMTESDAVLQAMAQASSLKRRASLGAWPWGTQGHGFIF